MNAQTATAQTATEAFERYKAALEADALIQSSWHTEQDGRQLACALGVIGENVDSPSKCPAAIMPRWLAQMVPWFFDNQDPEDARSWGLDFYAELARINGNVPFSVVHDWQANAVGPLAIEMAEKQSRDVAAHKALAAMQAAALTGKKFTADEWCPVLKAAFFDIYKFRYRANADANAYANADANAYANADANADANAYANADANAYANADANAYADAYANANAYANADANAKAYRTRMTLLARGMVDCLKRVEA